MTDFIGMTTRLALFYAKISLATVVAGDIGLVSREFANGPGDLGSIPGHVIPKTLEMVLDASLLNIQHYKIRNQG